MPYKDIEKRKKYQKELYYKNKNKVDLPNINLIGNTAILWQIDLDLTINILPLGMKAKGVELSNNGKVLRIIYELEK